LAVVASATAEIPLTQAGKGHVPEEHLDRYRSLARTARQLDTLADRLAFTDDGLHLFALAAKYWGKANALRVDL